MKFLQDENLLKEILIFVENNKNYLKISEYKAFMNIFDQIFKIRLDLKKLLSNFEGNLKLSHNDLNLSNILINSEKSDILLLDYEYSSLNPLFYDIANFFTELKFTYHSTPPHFTYNNENGFD